MSKLTDEEILLRREDRRVQRALALAAGGSDPFEDLAPCASPTCRPPIRARVHTPRRCESCFAPVCMLCTAHQRPCGECGHIGPTARSSIDEKFDRMYPLVRRLAK